MDTMSKDYLRSKACMGDKLSYLNLPWYRIECIL